jgi:dihydroflavonol-4-reductase
VNPVFVTGGSGLIGKAVIAQLIGSGREVRALARSDRARAALEALGAEAYAGDVADAEALLTGMAGCAVAYHIAGLNAFCLRDPAPLFFVNVEGSLNVVKAAAESGVRRGV